MSSKNFLRFAGCKQQAVTLYANGRPMETSAFVNTKPETCGQLLLHWDQLWTTKTELLWRHKFPPGCDGRVSKFPIQSLLL